MGDPGTGKTLLAKAIAGEAGVPFFSISGSDFVEMFVGVGANGFVIFSNRKKECAMHHFQDEIDGRKGAVRVSEVVMMKGSKPSTNLVEMDGFAPNEGIIVIAATNRPDVLDPALMRLSRFDNMWLFQLQICVVARAFSKFAQADTTFVNDLQSIARGTLDSLS